MRWVEKKTTAIINSINDNYEELRGYISSQVFDRSVININTMVKNFCESLNNYVLPYCDVHTHDSKNVDSE